MTARTITTAAELEALPVGSVVMCDDEHGVAKRVDVDRSDGYDWLVVGSDEYRETHEMTWVLPATVLHDPSAPVVPVVSDAAVEALSEWDVDEGDVAAIRGAALEGAAWALIDRTSDTSDREPSAETIRDALRGVSAAFPLLGAAPSATAIRALQARIGEINDANGWRDAPPPAGFETTHDIAVLALISTEVSEAIEELRNGRGLAAYHGPLLHGQTLPKPEGVPSELADVVIRALDFADLRGIDLAAAIEEKLAYNATRGHRHGEKAL